MSGDDAVLLWHRWRVSSDQNALDLLVKYNQEDVINLKPLAEEVYKRLKAQSLSF